MGNAEPIRYAQSADLPYERDRVFDLVADIERYPEFLPEYRAVRICSREGDTLQVEQVVNFPVFDLTLSSVATLRRPESIVVQSHQALLGDLEIRWEFKPGGMGTLVDFRMALMPPSRFGAGLVEYLLSRSAARTLRNFAERAQKVYGRDSGKTA